MSNNRFSIIPNIFLSDNSHKFTPDELSIYYLVVKNELKWFNNLTKITINQLANEVRLMKNEHQNKKRIKECLFELQKKNAIDFEIEDITNPTPINIVFKNSDYYNTLSGLPRGHTQVSFSLFDMARNSEELYVLCLIKKNEKFKSEIAYSTFATLLGICEKSAKTLINNMVDAGLINKESGQFYLNSQNQVRQEINKYEIVEGEKIDVQTESEAVSEKGLRSNASKELNINQDNGTQINWGNWNKKIGKKYVNITEQDYFLYELQKDMDDSFKNKCEKRINALKKVGFDFSKMERYAKNKIYRTWNRELECERKIEEIKNQKQIMNQVKEKRRRNKNNRVREDNGFDVTDWDDAG